MLEIKELTIVRGGKTLLENASFIVRPGTVTCLAAPNGHGKTTLLRTIAGDTVCLARGSVLADGVVSNDGEAFNRKVFYAPCDGRLLHASRSARWHLHSAVSLWNSGRNVNDIAVACGIESFLDKQVGYLSKGMHQQVSLAVAYATGVPYILLDEPMNALDAEKVQLFSDMFCHMALEGQSVLLSTHLLTNARSFCDSVLFMQDKGFFELDCTSEVNPVVTFLELYGPSKAC